MLNVLLTTAMFVGGSVAFILDNTIPGKVHSVFVFVSVSFGWRNFSIKDEAELVVNAKPSRQTEHDG